MPDPEILNREEALKQLEISEDTLSVYENELQMNAYLASSGLEKFTSEDLQSIKMFHKLRESGMTYNEIKLLSSFSEVLMNVDFERNEGVKNLLSLSPVYRLKQSLNLARQELSVLRSKIQELEDTLNREAQLKASGSNQGTSLLRAELEAKQKALSNLDRKLSETLLQKTQLESQLALYAEASDKVPVKGKKAKQLQQTLVLKEQEILDLKKKSEELQAESDSAKEESSELKERLELTEVEIAEMEHEIEERYKDQLTNLREQIEGLVDNKQKEWEKFYVQTNEQHRKELLTLQRRHEQEILRLKQKIKEQIEELQELRSMKNPLVGLFKIGSARR